MQRPEGNVQNVTGNVYVCPVTISELRRQKNYYSRYGFTLSPKGLVELGYRIGVKQTPAWKSRPLKKLQTNALPRNTSSRPVCKTPKEVYARSGWADQVATPGCKTLDLCATVHLCKGQAGKVVVDQRRNEQVERTTPSLLPGLAQRCIAHGSYFLVVGILYATPTVPLSDCPMDDQVGSPPWMVRTNLQTLP